MTAFELLVGAEAFVARAERDMAGASERLLVQAMTFEGDSSGMRVADAVRASGARDRRVLVDDYSRHVINDRILASRAARRDPALQAEVQATRAMFDGLAAAGVGVRITNPIGRNPLRYVVRNHKKLILADRVAYIGGINFSDHNFAWHDLMLRIDLPQAADFLARDFDATWNGTAKASSLRLPGIDLLATDGRGNRASFARLFDLIAGARSSIELFSPYATFPFLDAVGAAAKRGVAARLWTPLPNNKPIARDHGLDAARRWGIGVVLLAEMTHMKAMLIDGEKLVLGSSNFDFVSYSAEEEYVAIVEDAELIRDFEARVLEPALASAVRTGWRPSLPRRLAVRWSVRAGATLVRPLARARRSAVDW